MPLRIKGLSICYRNKWALRDVDIEVADGEIYGVLGATGSGKSSLMRCIAGYATPHDGTVDTSGESVFLRSEPKARGLFSTFRQRSLASSSGESNIAAIEEALNTTTSILLFDEPFSSIDEMKLGNLEARLHEMAAVGRTIMIATSDFQRLAPICDRITVLVDGYSHQTGSPRNLYEEPQTAAVAAITGSNNLFEARRLTSTNASMPEFFSIDGEHRLFAQPTEKHRLGAINQNVMLAIRPENISISSGASFPEDNLLKAVVTGLRFRGDTSLIELDANGLRLIARVFRVVGLDVGEECMISLPPDRISVLKN